MPRKDRERRRRVISSRGGDDGICSECPLPSTALDTVSFIASRFDGGSEGAWEASSWALTSPTSGLFLGSWRLAGYVPQCLVVCWEHSSQSQSLSSELNSRPPCDDALQTHKVPSLDAARVLHPMPTHGQPCSGGVRGRSRVGLGTGWKLWESEDKGSRCCEKVNFSPWYTWVGSQI